MDFRRQHLTKVDPRTVRVNRGPLSNTMFQHWSSICCDSRLTAGFCWPIVYVTLVQASPVAETCFSDRLTAYKIVGHFFGLSYRKISGDNQVENSLFRISNISVPCPHAQLGGRTVIKTLWTFFGPWGHDRSQSPPCWIFRVKQIHQSTASEWTTGLGPPPSKHKHQSNVKSMLNHRLRRWSNIDPSLDWCLVFESRLSFGWSLTVGFTVFSLILSLLF